MKIKRFIDLSQSIDAKKYKNPGLPEYDIRICATHEKDGWMAESICAGLHAGTHIDAPLHKIKNGKTIADYPLERFQGESIAIDLFNKEAGSEIDLEDLAPYDSKIKKGDNVLLCTGWGLKKNRGNIKEYIYRSPWLGEQACNFLIGKKINSVGIDHFSIGGMKIENANISHELLLSEDILIFEDLFLPRLLLEKERWYIVAFPILIGSVSGSFARIVAIDFE